MSYLLEQRDPQPHIAVVGIGNVGQAFLRSDVHAEVTALTRLPLDEPLNARRYPRRFDITDGQHITTVLRELHEEHGVRTVINTAGAIRVTREIEDQRESSNPHDSEAYRANVLGPQRLALACSDVGLKFIHLSTSAVFGQDRPEPYREDETPDLEPPYFDEARGNALSYYGETKWLGEEAVLAAYSEGATIIRMGGVQNPQGGLFARTLNDLLGVEAPEPFERVNNAHNTHLTDGTTREGILVVENALHTPGKKVRPRIHITATTSVTPYGIAKGIAGRLDELGIATAPFVGITQDDYEAKSGSVPRSRHVLLDTTQFQQDFYPLPTTEQEIVNFVDLYLPTFRLQDR